MKSIGLWGCSLRLIILGCWVACVLPEHVAQAQQSPVFDPFQLPRAVMLCRKTAQGTSGHGVVFMQIVEEDVDSLTEGRTFTVRFDTLGTPVSLFLLAHERLSERVSIVHGIAAEFGVEPTGMHSTIDDSLPIEGRLPATLTLSSIEMERARLLAERLVRDGCWRRDDGMSNVLL